MDLTNNGGFIKLYLGPMFASKTTKLMAIINKCIAAEVNCCTIKFVIDDRYTVDRSLINHDQQNAKTDNIYYCRSLAEASGMIKNFAEIQIICIDEGQFFSDINIYPSKWANIGKKVYIAALDGDFNQSPFPICDIIPQCDFVKKYSAICMNCKKNRASFSVKLNTNNKSIIDIGGKEKYKVLCRSCLIKFQQNKN